MLPGFYREKKLIMQKNMTPPVPEAGQSRPDQMGSIALLRLLIARHPYKAAAFFLVYWTVLLLALGRLLAPVTAFLRAAHFSLLSDDLLAEILLVLIVLFPVLVLRWGFATGFLRGINGQGLVICIVPIILIAGPSLLALPVVAGQAPGIIVASALVLSLLVGIAEEGMFRGLLVSSLLPKGIWPAVLISAVLFAATHLVNLLSGTSWGYVFGQLVLAFGIGVLFATLRLRTGSIWPGIILHATRDLAGLILIGMNPSVLNTPFSLVSNIANMVFCAFFVINALILLRPSQKRKLEVAYGLAKQPAAVMASYPSVPYQAYTHGYSPYPMYGVQPPSPNLPGNPPLPYQGEISYQEYTSPAMYGEQSTKDAPEQTPLQGQEQ